MAPRRHLLVTAIAAAAVFAWALWLRADGVSRDFWLMQDQVGALEEAGVHAAFLNSSLDLEGVQHVERELLSGRLVTLYAAPERITHPRFLAAEWKRMLRKVWAQAKHNATLE